MIQIKISTKDVINLERNARSALPLALLHNLAQLAGLPNRIEGICTSSEKPGIIESIQFKAAGTDKLNELILNDDNKKVSYVYALNPTKTEQKMAERIVTLFLAYHKADLDGGGRRKGINPVEYALNKVAGT